MRRPTQGATQDQFDWAIRRFGPDRAGHELRRRGLLPPIAGASGFAFVNYSSGMNPGGGTPSYIGAGAGHLLLVGITLNNQSATVSSISDSAGDTWYSIASTQPFASDVELWYDPGCSAGTHALTVTWSSTLTGNVDYIIAEYSGGATSSRSTPRTPTAAPRSTSQRVPSRARASLAFCTLAIVAPGRDG